MKRQKSTRILGVGLGIGLATFGCYQWMPHPVPQPFEAELHEFQPLSEYPVLFSAKSTDKSPAALVLFDEAADSDPGQTLIPATDEVTAFDAAAKTDATPDGDSVPMLSLDAPSTDAIAPNAAEWTSAVSTELSSLGDLVASGSAAEDTVVRPSVETTQESPELERTIEAPVAASLGTAELKAPVTALSGPSTRPPAESEMRLSEMAGSNWKPNPFSDGTAIAQDAISPLLTAAAPAESAAVDSSSFDSAADSENSVFEFQRENSILKPSEGSSESSEPWIAPRTEIATGDQASSWVGEESNQFSTDVTPSQSKPGNAIPNKVVSRLALGAVPLHHTTPSKRRLATRQQLSDSVAQRAAHHIEYGKSLARRGSSHVARQEFYSALRILSQANDASAATNEHSQALRNGILALQDAEDFVVRDTESQIGLNVAKVTETHRLNLLTESEKQTMTPIAAMQKYFTYAGQQLEFAGGRNVVAAEALYCLGKLHSVMSKHEPGQGRLDMAKAIVYHRASLNSDALNYRSANELGVLMARSGQMEEAKELLKSSLLIRPTPQTWSNLAKIHERLGETHLAGLAQAEFQRTLTVENSAGQTIQWMAANDFNANAPSEVHASETRKPQLLPKVANPAPEEESKPTTSLAERIKRMF